MGEKQSALWGFKVCWETGIAKAFCVGKNNVYVCCTWRQAPSREGRHAYVAPERAGACSEPRIAWVFTKSTEIDGNRILINSNAPRRATDDVRLQVHPTIA